MILTAKVLWKAQEIIYLSKQNIRYAPEFCSQGADSRPFD